ncbi:hypothetical protein ACRRTK_014829 [Alexandromys fortis]
MRCSADVHSFITVEPYKVEKVPNSLKKSNTQGFVPRGLVAKDLTQVPESQNQDHVSQLLPPYASSTQS